MIEQTVPGPDTIDLSAHVDAIGKSWWKAALLAVVAGTAMAVYQFRLPDVYRATAVVAPSEEGRQAPAAFGVLSSFGIAVGGSSKIEDLESLFRSNDLTVRIFRKYDLWASIHGDRYDPLTRSLRRAGSKGKPLGDWDAIRASKNRLKILPNKKSGVLSLSFDSLSPESSSSIVTDYLEEAKSRLQEEALERAARNKRFIEEQIRQTLDPLTRDRLYSLYFQEVEREMLARNRDQFGFKVIDSPRVPDRKIGPQRALSCAYALILSFIFFWGILSARQWTKQ